MQKWCFCELKPKHWATPPPRVEGVHFITALPRNVLMYIQNGEHHGNHQEGALTADNVQNALKKTENHLSSVTHLSEKKGNHAGRISSGWKTECRGTHNQRIYSVLSSRSLWRWKLTDVTASTAGYSHHQPYMGTERFTCGQGSRWNLSPMLFHFAHLNVHTMLVVTMLHCAALQRVC